MACADAAWERERVRAQRVQTELHLLRGRLQLAQAHRAKVQQSQAQHIQAHKPKAQGVVAAPHCHRSTQQLTNQLASCHASTTLSPNLPPEENASSGDSEGSEYDVISDLTSSGTSQRFAAPRRVSLDVPAQQRTGHRRSSLANSSSRRYSFDTASGSSSSNSQNLDQPLHPNSARLSRGSRQQDASGSNSSRCSFESSFPNIAPSSETVTGNFLRSASHQRLPQGVPSANHGAPSAHHAPRRARRTSFDVDQQAAAYYTKGRTGPVLSTAGSTSRGSTSQGLWVRTEEHRATHRRGRASMDASRRPSPWAEDNSPLEETPLGSMATECYGMSALASLRSKSFGGRRGHMQVQGTVTSSSEDDVIQVPAERQAGSAHSAWGVPTASWQSGVQGARGYSARESVVAPPKAWEGVSPAPQRMQALQTCGIAAAGSETEGAETSEASDAEQFLRKQSDFCGRQQLRQGPKGASGMGSGTHLVPEQRTGCGSTALSRSISGQISYRLNKSTASIGKFFQR